MVNSFPFPIPGLAWFYFHSRWLFPFPPAFNETSFAIPIPMGIPWDPRDLWEFPIYTHLYYYVLSFVFLYSASTGSHQ